MSPPMESTTWIIEWRERTDAPRRPDVGWEVYGTCRSAEAARVVVGELRAEAGHLELRVVEVLRRERVTDL